MIGFADSKRINAAAETTVKLIGQPMNIAAVDEGANDNGEIWLLAFE